MGERTFCFTWKILGKHGWPEDVPGSGKTNLDLSVSNVLEKLKQLVHRHKTQKQSRYLYTFQLGQLLFSQPNSV